MGGSSWELKIDPKRLQEKMNNDFEEDRTRRSEKNENKNVKKEVNMGHDRGMSRTGGIWESPRRLGEGRLYAKSRAFGLGGEEITEEGGTGQQ